MLPGKGKKLELQNFSLSPSSLGSKEEGEGG